MRWSLLPVGLQRPSPRHLLTGWIHGSHLIISGGCTPAAVAGSGGERCYSDVWKLPADGLAQGGKRLNVTAPPLEGDEAMVLRPSAVDTSRRLLRAKEAAAAAAAAAAVAAAATNGSTRLAINDTNATAAPSAPNASSSASGSGAGRGRGVVTVDFAAEGEDSVPPLYADPTLNGGMDVLSAPTAASSSGLPEAACQYVNLSRCEHTRLLLRSAAGALQVSVIDTTRFSLGRYIRINPGGINEEDNRIVGFGLRLTAEERHQLEVAIRRDAAENAKEGGESSSAGGGREDEGEGERRAKTTSRTAMLVEEHRPAADTLPRVEGPAARGATGTAFLQMAASARALLPGGAGSTMLSGMKASRSIRPPWQARADVPMAAKSTITSRI